jgi:hypothetical protein
MRVGLGSGAFLLVFGTTGAKAGSPTVLARVSAPMPETDVTSAVGSSIAVRVGETEGLEPLLAFSTSVPKEELAGARSGPRVLAQPGGCRLPIPVPRG